MSLQRMKLCVDHNHLHGGKSYFGSNHDDCTICQRMGYSEEHPPPASNFDYDGPLIKLAVCAGCGNSVGVRLDEGPPTSCKEHS